MQQRADEAKEHEEATLEDEGEEAAPAANLAAKGRDLYVNIMKGAATKPDKASIKANFQESGEKFQDSAFPANAQSLIENWRAAEPEKQWAWKKFVWKDIDEIYPQPIKVFNDIQPSDILQGELGDCYFLSTLSAMAEFPQRIQKLFETSEYEPSGCYKVKIMDMGVWKEYVLDDYFPCHADGTIAFSGPKVEKGATELWVVLLEKAWAKRFGCYLDIEAGFTNECLTDLTGAPCEVVDSSHPEIWDKVFQANQQNFIITAGSGGSEEGQDLISSLGLVGLHAYAIIDAQTVQTARGPVNLIMIRNPWGQGEWTGDWSDNSSKWTPAIKKQLNWQPRDDGTFWMCLDDFCNYFTDVTICMVHDHYDQTAIHVNQAPGKFTVCQLSIRKAGKVYVIICQPDTRIFNDDPDYQYAPVRQILAKLNPDGSLTLIGGEAEASKRDMWDEYDLEPGEYLVYTEVTWDGAFTTLHGISFYAHHRLGLKNVTSTNQDFLTRVYNKTLARSMVRTPRVLAPGVNYYSCERIGYSESAGEFLEGFIFDVIDNTSTASVEVNVIHKVLQNLELCLPFSGDSVTATVPAGQSVTIVKKQVSLTDDTGHSIVTQLKRSRK